MQNLLLKKMLNYPPHGNNLQIREGFREQAFSYTQPFTLAYSNTLTSFQIALHFKNYQHPFLSASDRQTTCLLLYIRLMTHNTIEVQIINLKTDYASK
jgi:hypothetical protein